MTIISHKYKFIFLKTFKTASSSVELSLSRYCGDNDTITPLGDVEDSLRKASFDVSAQNDCRSLSLSEYSLKDFLRLIIKRQQPSPQVIFYRHMPAREVKQKVGSEIWNNYFKFCFVRNPWDRAISNYYFLKGLGQVETLEEALQPGKGINNNSWIYTINNEIAVDYIGKYETLLDDLTYVCNKLSIPFDKWLPKLKGEFRQYKKPYFELLTEEQANHIRKVCAKEVEWFNYKF